MTRPTSKLAGETNAAYEDEALATGGGINVGKVPEDEKPAGEMVTFEEAISLTGHGMFHYRLLFCCGICLVAMLSEVMNVSFLLPAAQCDFHMSSNEKGLLNAICYVGMISSSHFWGYMADTRGRRKILIITLLLDCVCAVACSLAPYFWLYLTLRFFNGFFICGPSAVVFAYLGEFHSVATRARALILVCVVLGLGAIAVPGIAWIVIPIQQSLEFPWFTYRPWRIFVALCGFPSLVSAILLRYLPESPKFLLEMGKEEEAMEVLRSVYEINTGNSANSFPVKGILLDAHSSMKDAKRNAETTVGSTILDVLRSVKNQTVPLFRKPHLPFTLIVCFMQFGLYISFNGLLLWLPDVFNRMAEYSATHAGEEAAVCDIIESVLDLSGRGISSVDILHINHTELYVNGSVYFSYLANETIDTVSNNHSMTYQIVENATLHEETLRNLTLLEEIVEECVITVNPEVFQNTLIIGAVTTTLNLVNGFLVNYIEKKTLILASLTSSGMFGVGIYFAQTSNLVFALSCLFVTMSGSCVGVVNSVVVEIFPTNLRAMAVCLSLMMGRLGTVTGSLMMGSLLELNCPLVFFTLSGVVLGCGSLSCFLPTASKVRKHVALA